jgi:hypothetical protein
MSKLVAQSRDAPPTLRSLAPEIPSALVKVVARMMAKKAAGRYQTPADVAAALARWSDASSLLGLIDTPDNAADESQDTDSLSTKPLRIAESEPTFAAPYDQRPKVSPLIILGVVLSLILSTVFLFRPRGGEPLMTTLPVTRQGGSHVTELPDTQRDHLPRATAAREDVPMPTHGPVVDSIQDLARTTREIRDDSRAWVRTGQSIHDETRRIADTLQDLRATFLAAAQQGGLVANPVSAGEFYHNARLCEQQGQHALARQFYLQLLQQGLEFVDVHERFQRFLILQDGERGAQSVYQQLPPAPRSPVRQLAIAMLSDVPEREHQLRLLLEAAPDFAPAMYQLSCCRSERVLGQQTLTDKTEEKARLERFLQLQEDGQFLPYFLDQTVAAQQLRDARQRLAALSGLAPDTVKHPVTLTAARHRTGWRLTFRIAEPARNIRYRIRPQESFLPTGPSSLSGQDALQQVAYASVSIPSQGEAHELQVTYSDAHGHARGPFTIQFEPRRELVRDAQRKLELTEASWVRWGTGDAANRLYFLHLAGYKDAIAEVRYAIDDTVPKKQFELPDLGRPNSRSTYAEVPRAARYAVVQVTFADGSQSAIVRFDRPEIH